LESKNGEDMESDTLDISTSLWRKMRKNSFVDKTFNLGGSGSIEVTKNAIKIKSGGEIIKVISFEKTNIPVLNKDVGAATAEHEQQHRLDALFRPNYAEELTQDNVKFIAETSKKSEDFEKSMTVIFGQDARKTESQTDAYTRDEIIAYFKEGTPIDDIPKFLSLEIYQVVSEKDLDKITQKLADKYQKICEELKKCGNPEVESKLGDVDISLLKNLVRDATITDFPETIKKWLDSLKLMTEKGYAQEEILSMIYMEQDPDRWPATARRLKPKKAPQTEPPAPATN
jgi:hypothetical protein